MASEMRTVKEKKTTAFSRTQTVCIFGVESLVKTAVLLASRKDSSPTSINVFTRTLRGGVVLVKKNGYGKVGLYVIKAWIRGRLLGLPGLHVV